MLLNHIEKLVKKLGNGGVDPVAYDAAWVSDIPCLLKPSQPAFPATLAWLREHQLPDGSWGTDEIVHVGSNIVSTLAAIKVFSLWRFPEDDIRIKNALIALEKLILRIDEDTNRTVRFPLLLTMFVNELGQQTLPDIFVRICQERYPGFGFLEKQFSEMYKKKQQTDIADTWWFSLELLGTLDKKETIFPIKSNLFSENGSVFASPSATAYAISALRRAKKPDFAPAFDYLTMLVDSHAGGVPHWWPIDEFELSFGLDYLLKGGVEPTSVVLRPAMQLLYTQYCNRNGIASSKHFPLLDVDDTAVAIHVLYSAGYPITAESLLPYFNGSHVLCFIGDLRTTLSVNLSALHAFSLFQENQQISHIVKSIVNWIEEKSSFESIENILTDQFHLSPYYNAMKIVFSLYAHNSSIVDRCLQWILMHQRKDGGWGCKTRSTFEETAYAVLSLNFALKQQYDIPLSVLERADAYFSSLDFERGCSDALWVGKVLCNPRSVVEAAVLGARYALINTLQKNRAAEKTF